MSFYWFFIIVLHIKLFPGSAIV